MPRLNSQSRVAGYAVVAATGIDADAAARAVVAELPRLRPAGGRAAIEAALAGRGALLRFRPHRAAFLLDLPALGAARVQLKLYEPKDAVETAIGVVTAARGRTSWILGRAMRAAGLPTPEPLLLMLRKPFRLHRETVLITRALESPVLLTDELKRRLAERAGTRALLDETARLAAEMHDAGFLHGDFTASNLVLAGAADARILTIIDLDRARDLRRLPGALRRRAQVLDLRLLLLTTWGEVPRCGWLRLLVRYAAARKLTAAQTRRLATRVLSARRGRVRVGARAPTIGGPTPWSA